MAVSSFERRLWSKLLIGDGCWLWQGVAVHGYGRMRRADQKNRAVHRLVYELLVGPIPAHLEPDHLCRQRNCARPDHLELVTHRENTMRGDTIGARNSAKATCPAGHAYDIFARGRRACRRCINERRRLRRAGAAA